MVPDTKSENQEKNVNVRNNSKIRIKINSLINLRKFDEFFVIFYKMLPLVKFAIVE